MNTVPTPHERANGLRQIVKTADLWPEANEELLEAANLLDTMGGPTFNDAAWLAATRKVL